MYHQPGIDLLFKVIPRDNILFGSGDGRRGARHRPGDGLNFYDDTKRYVEALQLSDAENKKVYEGNARRAYPRLGAILDKLAAQEELSGIRQRFSALRKRPSFSRFQLAR